MDVYMYLKGNIKKKDFMIVTFFIFPVYKVIYTNQ